MKTRLCITILSLIVSSAAMSQITFGVQAGAVLSKPSTKISTDLATIKPDSRFGFSGGLIADIPFGDEPLRMVPELKFVQKGAKYNFATTILGQELKLEGNSNVNYIELPVNLAYAFKLGNNKLFVGGGPYAGYGLSGKNKGTGSVNGQPSEESSEDIEFGSEEGQMKRFDYGGNLMVGYFMQSGLMIKANYTRGFANLANGNDEKYNNSYFGLSLAYFINRN